MRPVVVRSRDVLEFVARRFVFNCLVVVTHVLATAEAPSIIRSVILATLVWNTDVTKSVSICSARARTY